MAVHVTPFPWIFWRVSEAGCDKDDDLGPRRRRLLDDSSGSFASKRRQGWPMVFRTIYAQWHNRRVYVQSYWIMHQ